MENRIINLSSTNLSDTITFVIDASDVNGIGSISMPGAQLVNSPNVFSKVINYDPAKTSRYGDSGETISFLVIVKDVYNNETQETVSFIVKQNNDAAPIIQDIFLDKTSITLNESNLTNDTVRVTVLATDADFRAVTLPGLGHTLTSPNLPAERIVKAVDEYGIFDSETNEYKFVWELTYQYDDFTHFSNATGESDLTETITVQITDGTRFQTADVDLTIIRNDIVLPIIKNATRLQQLQPAYTASVADDTTFTITASDPEVTHTLRFNLDAKVVDNGSGLRSVTAKFYKKMMKIML